MTETNSQIDQLLQKAEACGKTTLELYKLKGLDSLSKVISSYALSIIIGFCLFIELIFLCVGAAFWIGDAMSNTSNGFIIVSFFYVVLTFLIYQFGTTSIKRAARNAIISILLKSN